QLVDEDEARLRFRNRAGEFAKRLRHQSRLESHRRIAHVAVDFGFRHQRRHRVDHDDVDAVGADKDFDDFECLLTVVGLRDEEVVEIDAQFLRVDRVERMFRVHECRDATKFLRFRDDLQRQRRLARGFRTEDFDDAAAWHAADTQRIVDADRTGRNGIDRLNRAFFAEAHDRALAELLFDLADSQFDRLHAFAVLTVVAFLLYLLNGNWRHGCSLSLGRPAGRPLQIPGRVEGPRAAFARRLGGPRKRTRRNDDRILRYSAARQ